MRKALEILLTNPTLTAQDAKDIGLVTEVVDDDALTDRVSELARQLAAWHRSRSPRPNGSSGTVSGRRWKRGWVRSARRVRAVGHGRFARRAGRSHRKARTEVRRIMTAATVHTERRGAVELVTLNRPERRNAIDLRLRVELAEILEAAAADDAIRSIVITGAGKMFCSGGDISTMKR